LLMISKFRYPSISMIGKLKYPRPSNKVIKRLRNCVNWMRALEICPKLTSLFYFTTWTTFHTLAQISTNYKQELKAFGWTLFHRTTYILATLIPKLSKHPYTSNQEKSQHQVRNCHSFMRIMVIPELLIVNISLLSF
jgi:hypothetical protein